MTKLLSAVLLSIMLTNCAGLSQAVAAKEKSDKIAVQAANDNIVEGIKDGMCALPYGTILRHPEIQPAAQSLCGATANPAALLPASSAAKAP